MLELIHYTHVLAGAVFIGGVIFWEWVLGWTLSDMSPEERRATSRYLRKYSGSFILWAMVITVLAGIARLLMSGMIGSFADLFQGYGLRATLALVAVIAGEALMSPLRKRMRRGIDEMDNDMFLRAYHRHRIVTTSLVAIVLFLMVSMRMGIY